MCGDLVALLWTDRLQMFTGDTDDSVFVWYEQRTHAALRASFTGQLSNHQLSTCVLLVY